MASKRVLIVYYSYTQQTRLLLKKFSEGLATADISVTLQRLEPVSPYEFPFRSNLRLLWAMTVTFFRRRMAVKPPAEACFTDWDRIIVAGPTWSFQPSGPVLAFFDLYGSRLFAGRRVLPVISCRSYWRWHLFSLRRALQRCGAQVDPPLVFCHPIREPWRVIGLVLQLRGKMVRRENSWFRRHYPGYGHSREQLDEAFARGQQLADELLAQP
ncbi:MAG: hypothetical protein V2I32_02325 [Desulforhopalus sp.]|nr:hypothetical protein [Desulforhopalus sp.]